MYTTPYKTKNYVNGSPGFSPWHQHFSPGADSELACNSRQGYQALYVAT